MAFHGKVALVTGGASGMGQVAALTLANQGAQVAIRRPQRRRAAGNCKEIREYHPVSL